MRARKERIRSPISRGRTSSRDNRKSVKTDTPPEQPRLSARPSANIPPSHAATLSLAFQTPDCHLKPPGGKGEELLRQQTQPLVADDRGTLASLALCLRKSIQRQCQFARPLPPPSRRPLSPATCQFLLPLHPPHTFFIPAISIAPRAVCLTSVALDRLHVTPSFCVHSSGQHGISGRRTRWLRPPNARCIACRCKLISAVVRVKIRDR